MNEPTLPTLKEANWRLRMRLNRLRKLVKVDAPISTIWHEIRMVQIMLDEYRAARSAVPAVEICDEHDPPEELRRVRMPLTLPEQPKRPRRRRWLLDILLAVGVFAAILLTTWTIDQWTRIH